MSLAFNLRNSSMNYCTYNVSPFLDLPACNLITFDKIAELHFMKTAPALPAPSV